MDKIKTLTGSIEGLHIEKIVLSEPFIDFSARFSSTPGTVVLLSGGALDCARHHILAAKPWLSFVGRGHDMVISIGDQNIHFEADPFETLRKLLNTFSFDQHILPLDPTLPVASGLFGYLSYDLKDHLEKLPRTSIDDLCLPQICLFAPSIVVVHDKIKKSTYLCVPERVLPGGSNLDVDLEAFEKIITSDPPGKTSFSGDAGGFRSNFEKKNYMDSIEQVKEYIASGHVYQVNMSQRFEMGFEGSAFGLFQTLYNNNPAPFFAFIQAGDHQIVSTSPERFILKTGNRVETRPIKGTRPRGNSPEQDKRLCRELMESRKDDAELSMIVDLLRNDLGKVCEGGTVRVTEHKRLEAYRNVYHLVSVVEGTLDRRFDSVDLITATFPGGIAIRTATIVNNRIIFSAGGGIVFDSNPGDEFDETLHKGGTLMEAFQGDETKSHKHTFAWINGTIKPTEQVKIPVTDLGFQYGYGFFETIRVDKGKPKFLDEHTERFNRAWKQLFFQPPPDLSWNEIIDQVITRNGFRERTVAVKIIATKGDRDDPPFNNTLMVTSHPYTHRLAGKKDPGLHILTYPEPRQTPLADHKTLNYLYYF
ncbi:MAG: chorismate-binding protein, partial [Deltaproteobacteria bacterium]|nr:chorismate-binding protein [Deltaproteobacteria bacterium]